MSIFLVNGRDKAILIVILVGDVEQSRWNTSVLALSSRDDRQDIFQEADRILMVPRWLGLCPLILRQDSFIVSFKMLVLALSVAFTVMFLAFFSTMELNFGLDNKFINYFLFFVELACYILSPFSFIFFPFPLGKLQQLNASLRNISLVDSYLNRLGYVFYLRSCRAPIHCRYLHWFTFVTIIPFYLCKVSVEELVWALCLHCPNFFVIITVDQMTSILSKLRSRLNVVIIATNDLSSSSTTASKLDELTR